MQLIKTKVKVLPKLKSQHNCNIFYNGPSIEGESPFLSLKEYELVGLAELKSFEKRVKKALSKSYRRNVNFQDSVSVLEGVTERFTATQETPKTYLNITDLLSTLPRQSSLNSKNTSLHNSATSYQDCKQRLASYRRIWDAKEQRRNDFSSIYKLADDYREKVQTKTDSTQKTLLWQQSLRSSTYKFKCIPKLRVIREAQRLRLKGQSKLEAEARLVTQQDKDGYLFKRIALNYALQH